MEAIGLETGVRWHMVDAPLMTGYSPICPVGDRGPGFIKFVALIPVSFLDIHAKSSEKFCDENHIQK